MIRSDTNWFVNNLEKVIFGFLWLLYAWLCIFARGGYWDSMPTSAAIWTAISLPIVFYTNANYLIPKFLRQGKVFNYIIISIGIYLAMLGVRLIFLWMGGASAQELWDCLSPLALVNNDLFGVYSIAFFLSSAYRLIRDLILNNQLINKLEVEKNQMQLAYLKSQVDPHFLFNTLNSIYATALEEESPKTADGITKLSTLMRYNLHDTQEPTILLEKELDYIRKYIELQSQRASASTNIDLVIDVKPDEAASLQIAPMVLIPFIENAFKHGVSPTENSQVNTQISLDDGILKMAVRNTIIRKNKAIIKSGVGLRNVKQRLQLLYPEKHLLKIDALANQYSVILQITLS